MRVVSFISSSLLLALAVQAQLGPGRETGTSSDATATSDDALPPAPTESTGCIAHGDHWHCSGRADGSEDSHDHEGHDHEHEEGSGDEVISDTAGEGCVQHGTHYHCPPGVSAPCTAQLGDYDLGLHVVALFVLLVASGLGVFLPVVLGTKASKNKRVADVFFVFRHFGTGVIISTAFIHLLMHAFVMFANECLTGLVYEAVAPAIAMAAVMIIFTIDFLSTRAISRKSAAEAAAHHNAAAAGQGHHGSPSGKGVTRTPSEEKCHDPFTHTHDFSSLEASALPRTGADRRAHWEVQLLEAGIIFHSILIGVTLGAQSGSGFVPTFCAIVFHQLFEGLGLGARIGRLEYPNGGSWKRWLMCTIYMLITPIGIAIGIGVRSSFNLSGESTILAIGVLDSLSAGILLYASIATLLVGDWLAGDMRSASTARVIVGAVALFLGLFAMSVIGKWA